MTYPQQQYKTSVYCNSSEQESICEQLAHICELPIYQEGYGTEQTLACPLLLFLMMCSLHGLLTPSGKGKNKIWRWYWPEILCDHRNVVLAAASCFSDANVDRGDGIIFSFAKAATGTVFQKWRVKFFNIVVAKTVCSATGTFPVGCFGNWSHVSCGWLSHTCRVDHGFLGQALLQCDPLLEVAYFWP